MHVPVRNAYALFNFGDFIDGSTSNVGAPYIQLLSIADKAKIHEDFVRARLGSEGNSSGNSGSSGHSGSVSHIPDFLALGVSVLAVILGATS
jgi:hypothetical protein